MRKIELQELIQDYLSGGDSPSDIKGKYHPEIIIKHMENAHHAIIFQTWLEGKNYADYSVLDGWARNYPLTIDTDHVILPFPPVQLPDNRGILQVTPQNDLTNPFVYLETNAQGVFAALEASFVLLKPSFYLEQNPSSSTNTDTHRLMLSNLPSGVTEVSVKMIVPLEQLDLFDEVAIPGGKENMMVQGVIELLRGKPVEDIVNDNIPKQ